MTMLMSDALFRKLDVKLGRDLPSYPSILPRNSFMGVNIVHAPYVPKARVPVEPKTDDMRAMVEDLIDRGEASPQFVERDQVIFMGVDFARLVT